MLLKDSSERSNTTPPMDPVIELVWTAATRLILTGKETFIGSNDFGVQIKHDYYSKNNIWFARQHSLDYALFPGQQTLILCRFSNHLYDMWVHQEKHVAFLRGLLENT